MSDLRIIFGDQLSEDISSLNGLSPDNDVILMMEVTEESSYVRHHKQKLVLALSAMRHFSETLSQKGFNIDYVKLDDPHNTGSFTTEIERAVARHKPDRIVVTHPSEWRVDVMVQGWEKLTGVAVEIREDDRFFATREQFKTWADGRRVWRMEHFYREMRRAHNILMDGDQPAGGTWNFDRENYADCPSVNATSPEVGAKEDYFSRSHVCRVSGDPGNRFRAHEMPPDSITSGSRQSDCSEKTSSAM
jgi:deoxyribodipyrimidine photolyase-related protein